MPHEPYQPKHLLSVVRLIAWVIVAFVASVATVEVTHSAVCGLVVLAFVGYLKWNTTTRQKQQASNDTHP